jgi:arsenate reductase
MRLLFLCLGNTCRSPMAEAMARGLGGRGVAAFSAGIRPTGRVAEGTLEALRLLGFDPSGLTSKGLGDVRLDEMDVFVSLIGALGLTYLPQTGAERVAWEIRDPYGEDLATYRRVARDLVPRIRGLLEELGVEL